MHRLPCRQCSLDSFYMGGDRRFAYLNIRGMGWKGWSRWTGPDVEINILKIFRNIFDVPIGIGSLSPQPPHPKTKPQTLRPKAHATTHTWHAIAGIETHARTTAVCGARNNHSHSYTTWNGDIHMRTMYSATQSCKLIGGAFRCNVVTRSMYM